jgi:voltage-gated potassium channel
MSRYTKLIIAIIIIFGILGGGTIQFHYAEKWSWVDSFYFTGTTMTTVAYGDLHPTHDTTKIFVVFYTMATIGVFLYALTTINEELFKKRVEGVVSFFSKYSKNGKPKKQVQTTLAQHIETY